MKRTCLFLVVPLIAVMVIGCASNKGGSSGSSKAQEQEADSDFPDWLLNPPMTEDAIYGIGIAQMHDTNTSKQFAEARARVAISFTLNANVQAMITDYTRQAGNSETQSNLQFAESISRQLTNSKLQGVTFIKYYQSKNGTWYCLAAMRTKDAIKAGADVVDSEASKYAEFKAMNAIEAMEKQLAKTEIKPESRDHD